MPCIYFFCVQVLMVLFHSVDDKNNTMSQEMAEHEKGDDENALMPTNDDGSFKCSICSRQFERQYNLDRHFKSCWRKTTKEKEPYRCILCGRKFVRKSRMKRHMKRHIPKLTHTCQRCEKNYVRKDKYLLHIEFCTMEARPRDEIGDTSAPSDLRVSFSDFDESDSESDQE